MLKKTTIAALTAMATAMSAFSPLAVNAVSIQADVTDSAVNSIPLNYERVNIASPETHTATTTSDDFQWAYTEPTEATVPSNRSTVTTVAPSDDNTAAFPIQNKTNITVKVVDSETGEHIDGAQVRLVETETPTSNQIKRDFGTWCSTDSETFTLNDVDYTLADNSSMFLMTAIIEHIPDGYSYNGNMYGDYAIDNIIDFGYWHTEGVEAPYYSNTITINLDKTYSGSFNAECRVMDSITGELIEDVHVALIRWDLSGNPQKVETWTTEKNTVHKTDNLSYILPSKYWSEQWEFVVEGLPDEYNTHNTVEGLVDCISINKNTPDTVKFNIYIDPKGSSDLNTNTLPQQYTTTTTMPPVSCDMITTQTTAAADKGTCPPWMNGNTQTTVAEVRACDGCGKEINVSDGIITPLGMFLCTDCRSIGMGGTRPQFPPNNETTTTATTIITDTDTNQPWINTTVATLPNTYYGRFKAMCYVFDTSTGDMVNGAELRFFDENARTVETWTSSDKCGHFMEVDYKMNNQDSTKSYKLEAVKLPDGYKEAQIVRTNGLFSDSHTINYGFKDILTFAIYVTPENPDAIIKPEQTTTTVNHDNSINTVTTLAMGNIKLNSEPQKISYKIGEPLDLTGLDISMTYEYGLDGKNGKDIIFNHVNPVDYPEAFIVNTHDFDNTKAGLYTIKVKCTDDYNYKYRATNNNVLKFSVWVTEESEISTNGGRLVYGDTNCDGEVSISDAVLIMQALINNDEYKISEWGIMNADVYNRGDGITTSDALIIQEVIANKISKSDLPIYN